MFNASQPIRAATVFFFFICCYAALTINLFVLQVYNHDFFKELAEKQHLIEIQQIPERALILDRNGKPLALNRPAISAFISPRLVKDGKTISFLKDFFPQAYTRYQERPEASFMFIKRNLSPEELDRMKDADLTEIRFLKEPHRHYPLPSLASVIGTTNIDNEGTMGIEYYFNDQLKGSRSSYMLQKDARSGYFYFEKKLVEQGDESKPIMLTIDTDLQFLVAELLQKTVEQFHAKQGSVLVLDATGEILVMANYPTFNPNNLRSLDVALTKNYCIAEQYEIGSMLKVFAALAALEEEIVTLDEIIHCHNTKSTILDGRRVNTTVAHGELSFADVIAKSNNIGIAQIAHRLGEKLYEHYKRVGFGTKTGVSLPGEQQGFVNPPSAWSKQSLISLSYGYEASVTLLQLARAFVMIANNGQMIEPRIVFSDEPYKQSEKLYSQRSIDQINEILERTTLHGTARRARMQGYTIRCKTGTANLLENGVYIDTKNSYSCGGIIEKGDYKRIIIVYIKQAEQPNLFASQVAVPLFEKVAQRTIIHDKVL